MEISMYFELPPGDIWVVGWVINAIPPIMDHINGRINAPKAFSDLRLADQHSGISITNGMHQPFVGDTIISPETKVMHAANYEALLVDGMLPGFFAFGVSGGNHRAASLARKVIEKYVCQKEYRGTVVFSDKDRANVCDMRLERWFADDSPEQEEVGNQPPRIRLTGQARILKPMQAACRSMHLRQYLPAKKPT